MRGVCSCGSTHHPAQQDVLVVGHDEDDVARFGAARFRRTPDAAGEQRRQQRDGRSVASLRGDGRSVSAPQTCHVGPPQHRSPLEHTLTHTLLNTVLLS